MKKDFQKFQEAFYEKVQDTLAEFSSHTHTLQVTKAPGIFEDEAGMLDVTFGFTDVTGKDRIESVLIEATDDVTKAVEEFNSILKEDYPAFAEFDSLADVIKTAVEVGNPDNCYQKRIAGFSPVKGTVVAFDLVFQMDEDTLCVSGESVLEGDDDELDLTYDMNEWKAEEVAEDIRYNAYEVER